MAQTGDWPVTWRSRPWLGRRVTDKSGRYVESLDVDQRHDHHRVRQGRQRQDHRRISCRSSRSSMRTATSCGCCGQSEPAGRDATSTRVAPRLRHDSDTGTTGLSDKHMPASCRAWLRRLGLIEQGWQSGISAGPGKAPACRGLAFCTAYACIPGFSAEMTACDAPLGGLALSQALALAPARRLPGWVSRELDFIFSNHRILVGLEIREQLGSRLGGSSRPSSRRVVDSRAARRARFCLARLTETAIPARVGRRHWLVAGWFVLLAGSRSRPTRPGSQLPSLPAKTPHGACAAVVPAHRDRAGGSPALAVLSCFSARGRGATAQLAAGTAGVAIVASSWLRPSGMPSIESEAAPAAHPRRIS